jgi:septum formation protein
MDRNDSITMLEKLSGRVHVVNTGVVIASLERKVSFNVSTKVYFHPLSLDEITTYVDEFKPYDKAGSYGIQEWIGCAAIQRIEGSYNNVVGLPTHEIYQVLKQFL